MWSAVYVAAFSSPPSSSVVYQSSSPLHTSWQFYIFLYVVLPFPLCCSADCPAKKKKKKGRVATLESGASGGLGQSSLEGRSHAYLFSLWQEQNVNGERCALRLSFAPSSGVNHFDGLGTFFPTRSEAEIEGDSGKIKEKPGRY